MLIYSIPGNIVDFYEIIKPYPEKNIQRGSVAAIFTAILCVLMFKIFEILSIFIHRAYRSFDVLIPSYFNQNNQVSRNVAAEMILTRESRDRDRLTGKNRFGT